MGLTFADDICGLLHLKVVPDAVLEDQLRDAERAQFVVDSLRWSSRLPTLLSVVFVFISFLGKAVALFGSPAKVIVVI